MNDAIPKSATSYQFPSDLTLQVMIDRHSNVSFDNASDLATYGGTIADPANVGPDIIFTISFDANGVPTLSSTGLDDGLDAVAMYAGLRDDPFIRGPRIGRNVASVVLDMPLKMIAHGQHDTILVWAVAKVPGETHEIADRAGRALRSMFKENQAFNNYFNPASDFTVLGKTPDLVIFDTTRPAAYPNGRALTDDVVNLVGDPRVLANDAPFPSTNDVPFLATFPYLAPPHNAPDGGYYFNVDGSTDPGSGGCFPDSTETDDDDASSAQADPQ